MKVAKPVDSKKMGKFDNKMANTGKLLLIIFKMSYKSCYFGRVSYCRNVWCDPFTQFVIFSNKEIKIGKLR